MPDSSYFEARQQALRSELARRKLPFFVVTKPENLFYLIGFRGSAGIVIFGQDQAALLVDPRYTIHAQEVSVGVEVREVRTGLHQAAGAVLRGLHARRISFEDGHLTVEQFNLLRKAGPTNARWEAGGGLVEELRVSKDTFEVNLIRKACELTARAYGATLPLVKPGVSERDLASELDYRMRLDGADGTAFETIVASGPRAALPHARPSARALEPGELVIIDLGAILGGYASDMTRTVYLGIPGRRVRRLYEAVLGAQCAAIEVAREGVAAGRVDTAARARLRESGLGRYFTHSTGHGVGIEIHERPRLAKGQKTKLAAQSVVTVEPGIYLKGFGGIRIEDTMLVGPQEPEVLTPASKDRWWVE